MIWRFVIRAALAMVVGAGGAVAQDAKNPDDFSFRRVAPPANGAKRITVQIAVGAPTVYPAPVNPPAPSPREPVDIDPDIAATGSPFDWYWATVSPAETAASPARFSRAVASLAAAPGSAELRPPRLQSLQEIAQDHGASILKATVGTRVSPALALAVISVESAGNTKAVSSAGAEGLMQLMPATADRFGVDDSFKAAENIRGGVAYLDWLLDEFDGDALLALAGYNAGENNVRKHRGVPPFAETRAYVPKVLAAWDVARGLCLTPPELPSDGCVFRVSGVRGG